jgi:hypothetical protein
MNRYQCNLKKWAKSMNLEGSVLENEKSTSSYPPTI